MRIHLTTSLCFLALTAAGFSQVFTPREQSNSSQPVPANQSQPRNASSTPSFGEEIPLLNPGDETITIGGLTMPLGDNRVIKARFEKYLNQPAENEAEAQEYHKIIKQITDMLAPRPGASSRQAKIEDAFTLLPIAATYPGDANMCETLAETIYASLQAKKDVRQVSLLNDALDAKRVTLAKRADWIRKTANDSDLGGASTTGQSGQSDREARRTRAQAEVVTSYEYLGLTKQIAEIEAVRKKHTIQGEQQILQTKIQFQSTMMQWLLQRRFHHVIMAARFYNVIWQDGDNELHIRKDSSMAKLFSSSLGFSPTVTALDSVANEAVRDTENAIDACNFMMDNGELHNASKRLLEAFSVGEFLTPLASLDRTRKRTMQLYIRELSLLFDAIQAKDFGRARELTVKLKNDAKDFPSSKAESAISANVIASNMAVAKAKNALVAEDEVALAEAIQSATEYWPTNPKIAEVSAMLETGTEVHRLRNDFTRLLDEKNYREIFKRQYEFAPVISSNPDDLDAFNQIIGNLRKIEGALGKAEEFVKIGNPYAAWEQLAILREEFPDDPNLGRELEKLAPKVADFTKALDIAQSLESRTPPQSGSAISYYLKAKSIYPSSEFVAQSLTKLIEQTIGN